MPVSMTFTSLQSDIRAYLERGGSLDPTVAAQLPSLINSAERNIASLIKVQGFIAIVNSAFVAGTSVYTKPVRWRETVSIHYGSGQARTAIFPREYGYCRAYWPDDTVLAAPQFYADYGYTHWLIVPTPDLAYNVETTYYELPALLDSVNSTNWLTDYAPTMLLYRALYETAVFLKDTERMSTYDKLFSDAMSSINTEDLRRVVDRTSTRQEA